MILWTEEMRLDPLGWDLRYISENLSECAGFVGFDITSCNSSHYARKSRIENQHDCRGGCLVNPWKW